MSVQVILYYMLSEENCKDNSPYIFKLLQFGH